MTSFASAHSGRYWVTVNSSVGRGARRSRIFLSSSSYQRVAAVVAPEEDDRGIPIVLWRHVVLQHPIEHAIAEVDESAGFGFDFHLPAEGHQFLAHLPAVPA